MFEIGDITPEENAKANEVAAEVEDKIARNKAASGAVESTPQINTNVASPEEPENGEISLDEVPF